MLFPYVIHYSPLQNRRKSIESFANESGLKFSFVTEDSVDPKSVDNCNSQFSHQALSKQVSFIYDLLHLHYLWLNHSSRGIVGIDNWKSIYINELASDYSLFNFYYSQALQSFSIKNITLSFQHFNALRSFLEIASFCDICLIIEDDSILISHQNLNNLCDDLPTLLPIHSAFFLDVSNSLGLSSLYSYKTAYVNSKPLFRVINGQTRCASAYIVNYRTALLLYSTKFLPFLPIDWFYSFLLRFNNIPTYWTNDSLFIQGSENGCFSSNSLNRASNV